MGLFRNSLIRDDATQVATQEAFIARGDWVPPLAVPAGDVGPGLGLQVASGEVNHCLAMLPDHRDLALQEAEVVAAAVAQFRERPSFGFSDTLMLEISRTAWHVSDGHL